MVSDRICRVSGSSDGVGRVRQGLSASPDIACNDTEGVAVTGGLFAVHCRGPLLRDPDMPSGFGHAPGSRTCRREPDMPPGAGHAAGIRTCRRDSDMPPGAGHTAGSRTCPREPDMPPGFGHAAGIRTCPRESDIPPGAGHAAGIRTCRRDSRKIYDGTSGRIRLPRNRPRRSLSGRRRKYRMRRRTFPALQKNPKV